MKRRAFFRYEEEARLHTCQYDSLLGNKNIRTDLGIHTHFNELWGCPCHEQITSLFMECSSSLYRKQSFVHDKHKDLSYGFCRSLSQTFWAIPLRKGQILSNDNPW